MSDFSRVPSIKVCGITRPADAHTAVSLGVSALGFNLWPGSKRFIPLESAKPWMRELSGSVLRVVLMVNAPLEVARQIAECEEIDAIQFHGDESYEYLAEMEQLLRSGSKRMIHAVRLGSNADLDSCQFPGHSEILADSHVPGAFGGTGATANLELVLKLAERHPTRPLWLAGGLTPENIAASLRVVSPAWVDVASGVESAPGLKDAERMRSLVEAVQGR
jgi:phosphoribosylanthranilate isomerase